MASTDFVVQDVSISAPAHLDRSRQLMKLLFRWASHGRQHGGKEHLPALFAAFQKTASDDWLEFCRQDQGAETP